MLKKLRQLALQSENKFANGILFKKNFETSHFLKDKGLCHVRSFQVYLHGLYSALFEEPNCIYVKKTSKQIYVSYLWNRNNNSVIKLYSFISFEILQLRTEYAYFFENITKR